MKSASMRLGVTALTMSMLLAACGGGSEDTADTSTEGAAAPGAPAEGSTAVADAWDADAPAEWETMLQAAADDGAVTIAGPAALSGPMEEGFRRDTGLDLDWVSVTGGEHHGRILQEVGSGKLSIDLSLSPSVPTMTYPEGHLQPVKPLLVLPSVTDPENWAGGELKFNDPEGEYIFQPAEYVFGWAMVNADKVDPASLTEWEDLLDPAYTGRIASQIASAPGPGEAVAGNLWRTLGEGYVEDLYVGQDVTFTTDTRQLAEWIARGEFDVALGGVQHDFERFIDEGFSIQPVLAGYLSGGFSPISMYKKAPHPDAAAVFLNWYASAQGQAIYQEVMLETSRRTDIAKDDVPSYVNPDVYPHSGVDGYEWDYYAIQRGEFNTYISGLLGER